MNKTHELTLARSLSLPVRAASLAHLLEYHAPFFARACWTSDTVKSVRRMMKASPDGRLALEIIPLPASLYGGYLNSVCECVSLCMCVCVVLYVCAHKLIAYELTNTWSYKQGWYSRLDSLVHGVDKLS